MNKTTFQKTTIITTISITVLLAGIFAVSGDIKFAEAGLGTPPPPPSSICPEEGKFQHWDKVVFHTETIAIKDSIGAVTQPGNPWDVKLIDDPSKAVDLESRIANFLNVHDYTTGNGNPVKPSHIFVDAVKYELITCGFLGPQGPQGPQGTVGPQGPEGPSNTYVKRITQTLPGTIGETPLSVDCEAGDVATGGGIQKTLTQTYRISKPIPDTTFGTPTGWLAVFDNTGNQAEVFVVCLGIPP